MSQRVLPSILVVEDDPQLSSNMAFILNMEGFDVRVAADGLAGLAMIRKKQPDLILCDILMPRMDGSGILGGLELIELLKDNFPDLTVMVLADHQTSGAEQKVRDLQEHINAYRDLSISLACDEVTAADDRS